MISNNQNSYDHRAQSRGQSRGNFNNNYGQTNGAHKEKTHQLLKNYEQMIRKEKQGPNMQQQMSTSHQKRI